jgi:hypothetical protein
MAEKDQKPFLASVNRARASEQQESGLSGPSVNQLNQDTSRVAFFAGSSGRLETEVRPVAETADTSPEMR